LNKKVGTGINGEAQPVIKHPNDKTKDGRKLWSNVSLPWMSIGYEVNVTPLHLITLYNAIANGGKMMKPQFVTEVRRGTQTIEKYEPIVLNEHIASPEAIEKLQTMLEGVVIRGTAKRQFKDCVVSVAGKTGTAQYYDKVQGYSYHEPGIGRKLYNTTFVGYFPTDKPKYSCIVVVSRARGPVWAAGSVSAPGFREIAEKVNATRIGIMDDDSTVLAHNTIAPVIIQSEKARNYLNGLSEEYSDYALDGKTVKITTYYKDKLLYQVKLFDPQGSIRQIVKYHYKGTALVKKCVYNADFELTDTYDYTQSPPLHTAYDNGEPAKDATDTAG
jgi:hypothetical protein